ncbi:MAG: metallophosphoesterase family protein [Oscillospiraceae bacterium]|nr:metallophosphoesterase family protein [Oscillospiraceae bacterium]
MESALDRARRPALRFDRNGRFTVMQISDVQDCAGVAARSMELLEAALDQARPDFVIFTGDQIKGYGMPLWFGSREQKERRILRTLEQMLEPLVRREIPFSFTFGNHDHDAPMDPAEQIRFYQSYALCRADDTPHVPGYANHAVQVLRSGGDQVALNFYLLDSHGSKGLGYQGLHPAQVEWYRRTRDALIEQNGGVPVPSFLFQHIPVEEIIELYQKVPRGTPGALEGFRGHKGSFYTLDTYKVAPGSFMGELPSSPDVNAGLFEAALEKGDMVGMYFGHDHNNGFHGSVRGIDLGYAPGVTFTAYGPGRRRGVRVFQFQEDDIRGYQTCVLTDERLLGPDKESPRGLRYIDAMPTSFGAAKPLVRRSAFMAAFAVMGGASLLALARHQKKRG